MDQHTKTTYLLWTEYHSSLPKYFPSLTFFLIPPPIDSELPTLSSTIVPESSSLPVSSFDARKENNLLLQLLSIYYD